jgi:hypothetical protein
MGEQQAMELPLIPGPDPDKIKALIGNFYASLYYHAYSIIDRTGYQLEVTVGQRKYHSPPGYQGPDPNQSDGGCVSVAFNSRKYGLYDRIFFQVYIGQIPKDVYEDALVTLFEPLGVIYDLSECILPQNY